MEIRDELEALFEEYYRYRMYGDDLVALLDAVILPRQIQLRYRIEAILRDPTYTPEEKKQYRTLLQALDTLEKNTLQIRDVYVARQSNVPLRTLRQIRVEFDRFFQGAEDVFDDATAQRRIEDLEEYIRYTLPSLRNIPETHPNHEYIEKLILDMEYTLNSLMSHYPPRTHSRTY